MENDILEKIKSGRNQRYRLRRIYMNLRRLNFYCGWSDLVLLKTIINLCNSHKILISKKMNKNKFLNEDEFYEKYEISDE